MATLYKRGKKWWIAYTMDGRRVQRSLKTTNRKIAHQVLGKLEQKLERRAAGLETGITKTTLTRFFYEYRAMGKRYKTMRTIQLEESCLKEFFNFISVQMENCPFSVNGTINDTTLTIDNIKPTHVEKFKTYRLQSVAKVTVQRELNIIKAALNYAKRMGYIYQNPCDNVENIKGIPKKQPEFLSEDECEQLLDVCRNGISAGINNKSLGPHIRPWKTPLHVMVSLAIYAGLRLGEIIHLEWNDIDFKRKMIRIRQKDGFTPKDKEDREIPMHNRLAEILQEYRKATGGGSYCFITSAGTLYNRANLLRELKTAAKKAGINCTWYKLRHTFASLLVMAGVSIYKVSNFLGHSSVETTQKHYAHLIPHQLHDDINKL